MTTQTPPRSLQEMFNLSYIGLAKQNWIRSDTMNGCVYFSLDGLRCAIGHTLDSENFDMQFNAGCSVNSLPSRFLNTTAKMIDLVELQSIHDSASCSENMKLSLTVFATRKNLTIPTLDN